MRNRSAVALALLAGFGLGAVTIQGLRAQAKPPAYAVVEIDVTDQDGFLKEFQPKGNSAITAAGGKFLARGGFRPAQRCLIMRGVGWRTWALTPRTPKQWRSRISMQTSCSEQELETH